MHHMMQKTGFFPISKKYKSFVFSQKLTLSKLSGWITNKPYPLSLPQSLPNLPFRSPPLHFRAGPELLSSALPCDKVKGMVSILGLGLVLSSFFLAYGVWG
jgi:hypothetical protein